MAGGETNETISFSRDVAPILKRRCAACHITGQEPGLLSLVPARAYGDLVGVRSVQSAMNRVSPGEPENSYVYHKLVGSQAEAGGEGSLMPTGMPPLSADQVELIRRWIEQGALDN